MYTEQFEYDRPDTVERALEVLSDNPGAKILAGGHSLIPAMKTGLAAPEHLVDVGGIDELRGIDRRENETHIGALTRYATLSDSEQLWDDVAVVAEAAGEIGDVQVRNRGTIGGNIAHSDPASDLPGAVLAADATVVVQGSDGEREIPADEFFLGMYTTDVEEEEILTGIVLPHHGSSTGSAYVKRPSPSSGYAMVGVAAVVDVDDGDTVDSARVAANGVMGHAVRLGPTEDALEGVSIRDEDALAEAAERADDDLEEFMMMDDLQASSEFRASLLRTYTQRALDAAIQRID